MSYLCERCHSREARPKEKYCKECRKEVVKELTECGYLQRIYPGHSGSNRPGEARENTYETKHGTGHG